MLPHTYLFTAAYYAEGQTSRVTRHDTVENTSRRPAFYRTFRDTPHSYPRVWCDIVIICQTSQSNVNRHVMQQRWDTSRLVVGFMFHFIDGFTVVRMLH
jgi:hypothetical protein